MADRSITKNVPEQDVCCRDVVKIYRRATPLQLVDAIQERCGQVGAQLRAITSEGLEHFESLSSEDRGNYLWAVEQKFSEIVILFDLFLDVAKPPVMAGAKHKRRLELIAAKAAVSESRKR